MDDEHLIFSVMVDIVEVNFSNVTSSNGLLFIHLFSTEKRKKVFVAIYCPKNINVLKLMQ